METWRTGSRCTNTHRCVLCLSHFKSLVKLRLSRLFQARNKTGQVGYVPEKYLQFPTSNSLLSMLQSLATLDARSHTSSNSTEPELHSNCINGDTSSECIVLNYYWMRLMIHLIFNKRFNQ